MNIYDMHSRQEMAIEEVATEAALQVIKERLGIDGFVEVYVD